MILVSEADIFFSESLRILAERLSQTEINHLANYRTSLLQIQLIFKKNTKTIFYFIFKSNVRETWRVILVSEADIFLTESLRILAERLSQSAIGLTLRLICYDSPPEEMGVFSTEIKYYKTKKAVDFHYFKAGLQGFEP